MLRNFFKKNLGHLPYRKVVFLAGSGRSGTTWLAELINHRKDFRYLFEPFHPEKVAEWSGFPSRLYLRRDETAPHIADSIQTVLTGQFNNSWTNKFWDGKPRKKLLVKDIRTNLMLHYLLKQFPGIKLLLIIRHPGAVVHSRIKLQWNPNPVNFLEQQPLVEDHLSPYADLIRSHELSPVEAHTLVWCIENYVPLKQFAKNGGIRVIFYENLVRNPEPELVEIFRYIKEPFRKEILQQIDKPSRLAKKHSAIFTPNADMLNSWKADFSAAELEEIRKITQYFGLDRLYDEAGLPLSENF